jgi:hypothetical protein
MEKSKVKFSLIGANGRRKEFDFELNNENEYFDLIEYADNTLEQFIEDTGYNFKRLDATTYKAYAKVPTGKRDSKGKKIYEPQLITVEEFDKIYENTAQKFTTEFLNNPNRTSEQTEKNGETFFDA